MDFDRRAVHDRFVEIIARALDTYDQLQEGKQPPLDRERWLRRYQGTPRNELPPFTIELNNFRPFVDIAVSQLMLALDDKAWAEATSPTPGLHEIDPRNT